MNKILSAESFAFNLYFDEKFKVRLKVETEGLCQGGFSGLYVSFWGFFMLLEMNINHQ